MKRLTFFSGMFLLVGLSACGDGGGGSAGSAGTSGSAGSAGTGGSAGSAGTGGSSGAAGSGGTTGSGGAAVCDVSGFSKTCAAAADCVLKFHQINCCGTRDAIGLAKTESAAFDAAETQCEASYPGCGCAQQPTTAEDGKTGDESAMMVDCISGACSSYVP